MAATTTNLTSILLIDDDESFNELLREYLRSQHGKASIESVNSGTEAWAKLSKNTYNLVILDWRLPGVSGMALFNRLRSLPDYEKIPVLVSSGLLQQADFRLLDEFACTICLAKPYSERALNDTIAKLMADSQWCNANQLIVTKLMSGVLQGHRPALTALQELLHHSVANTLPITLMAARQARHGGDLKTAEILLRTLLKKQPEAVPALFELAKVLFQDKQPHDAMALLATAQRLSPKNLSRAHMMGEVALNQAQPKAAEGFFTYALQIDPEHQPSQRGQALSVVLQQHLAANAGASKVEQSFASMINMMGIGLVRHGKYQEGIKRYQEAMEFIQDPMDKARLSYNLGLGLQRAGRPEDARKWYVEADRIAGGTLVKAHRALGHAVPDDEHGDDDLEETFAPTPGIRVALTPPPSERKPAEVMSPQPKPKADAANLAAKTAKAPAPTVTTKADATDAAKAKASVQLSDTSPVKAPTKAVADTAETSIDPPTLPPPADETLQIPEKAMAVPATLTRVKSALAEYLTRTEAMARGTTKLSKISFLLYHDQDQGWIRAEKQLQQLGAVATTGFSQTQPLLDTLRITPHPMLVLWNNGEAKSETFKIVEAVQECDFPPRVGVLVQCGGDKAILDARVQKPYLLMVDRLLLVNWTRARFDEQINSAVAAMESSEAMLSQLHHFKRQTSSLHPASPIPLELLADLDEAKSKANSSELQVWFDLVKVNWLARVHQLDQADALVSQVLKKAPDLFAARLAKAAVAAQQGKTKAALELAEWLTKNDQASPARLELLVSMLANLQQNQVARQVLQIGAFKGDFAKDYRYSYLAARLLFSEGQTDQAAVCCEAAIRLYPLRWELLELYAACLRKLNDPGSAVQVLDAALKCPNANEQSLLLLKSRCLGSAGKWREAELCVNKVLEVAPSFAAALALQAAIGRRKVA